MFNSFCRVPARFQYKDLHTEKLLYSPNETINITVTVENRGKAGSQAIGLVINDESIQEKTVFLNFLEEKDINFNITDEEIGQYRITINNCKIFLVEYKEGIVPVIILGLSILAILLYIIRKRYRFR